jgi:hypothetical protein
MSKNIDFSIDTSQYNYFPVINLHNGKLVTKSMDNKVIEWKSIPEFISSYSKYFGNLMINDFSTKVNYDLIDKFTNKFSNVWYFNSSSTKEQKKSLIEDHNVSRIVINYDDEDPELDPKQLVLTLILAKMRNKTKDKELLDLLKTKRTLTDQLIITLDDKYNSKEIVETTTQIYDLFQKDDVLEEFRININASNINDKKTLQLVMSCGTGIHLGLPLHREWITLGNFISLLPNKVIANKLRGTSEGLNLFPVILNAKDGTSDLRYMSMINIEQTVDREYLHWFNRYTRNTVKEKDCYIEQLRFNKDNTSLICYVSETESSFTGVSIKNTIPRLYEGRAVKYDLDRLREELDNSIDEENWEVSYHYLTELIRSRTNIKPVLDKLEDIVENSGSLEPTMQTSLYLYCDFSKDENYVYKICVERKSRYRIEGYLDTFGIKYKLIIVDNLDLENVLTFDGYVCEDGSRSFVCDPYYLNFEEKVGNEVFSDSDLTVYEVDDEYYYLFKKDLLKRWNTNSHLVKRFPYLVGPKYDWNNFSGLVEDDCVSFYEDNKMVCDDYMIKSGFNIDAIKTQIVELQFNGKFIFNNYNAILIYF